MPSSCMTVVLMDSIRARAELEPAVEVLDGCFHLVDFDPLHAAGEAVRR